MTSTEPRCVGPGCGVGNRRWMEVQCQVISDPELPNKEVRRSDRSGSPLQSSRDAGLADGLDPENSAAAASLLSGRC
jgi:hypothetical protein